jgi:hypothetical protein
MYESKLKILNILKELIEIKEFNLISQINASESKVVVLKINLFLV